MSNLTMKERQQLPLSNFADPQRRLFPIMDASDVQAAALLLGKAHDPKAVKTRIIAIARRKGLPLPKSWEAEIGKGKAMATAALKKTTSGR